MQIEKSNPRARKRAYVILALALVLSFFSILELMTKPLKTETLDVNFIIGDSIGFKVNTDKIDFGKVTPGGTATRNIIIENEYDSPVEVKIFVSKNLAGFVFAENNYIISPANMTKIPITLKIPRNMDFGNYTGKIKIEFRKT